MCFQKSPLLKTFSKVGIFGRFSVDDRRKRIKKYAFSNENALVWIGPINAPLSDSFEGDRSRVIGDRCNPFYIGEGGGGGGKEIVPAATLNINDLL